MKCPKCNSEDTKVIDKRATEEAEANRRRRECLSCGARFTTYERIETNLKVVKKDGHRVDFDENKIRRGIENSAGKRFTEEKTDALVDEVTEEIQKEHPSGEVSSSEIGEKVLAKLKDADEIAYLRFAAFHKGLENAEELQR